MTLFEFLKTVAATCACVACVCFTLIAVMGTAEGLRNHWKEARRSNGKD